MVILGIDPGLAHTGWGIIEERRGEVRCRAYGCIETSAGSPLAVRLSHIAHDLKGVVERYRPDTAAIESIYFGANVRSAIPTAHARGAALVALSECALEIGEYTWWARVPQTSGRLPTWCARSLSLITTHTQTMPPMPWLAPSVTLTLAVPGRLPAASSINREEPDTDDLPAPWNACRGHDELGRRRCVGRGL